MDNTNITRVLFLFTTLALLLISLNVGIASADEDLVAIRGESVTISIVLLQNGTYGNPIPEQEIKFFDQTNNQILGTDITDSSGWASIIWDIPSFHSLGPTIINATFSGNESLFLAPSSQNITLNILAATEIILHETPTQLAPGDTLSFSVTLLDDSSTPLFNRPLYVYSNSRLLATSVTNSTGEASFSINCNESWSALGENKIRIVHEQDLTHYYGRTETQFSIEIQQIQTLVQSNFSLESVLLEDSLFIEIELNSAEGGFSSDLAIMLDGTLMTTMNTNSFGIGVLPLTFDEQFSLGHHYLTIIYNGSERYTESTLILGFDILSPSILHATESSYAAIGQNYDTHIILSDILGRPIEGTVFISDLTNGRNSSIPIPHDATDFVLEFLILGPIGPHNLLIEVENSFLTNNTIIQSIEAWSQPQITIQNSNILHFASPSQEITFITQLTDWSGNISYQVVLLLCNDEILTSFTTDEYGTAILSTTAPRFEGVYNLSIVYPMNMTRYELSDHLDYHLTVSTSIPVSVYLEYYEVTPPLQQVTICLRYQCLNGSFLSAGIPIKIVWQSIESYIMTQQGGLSLIRFPVPGTSGNYSLYYEIPSAYGLATSNGTINIFIAITDVLASQGIGMNGFMIGILASFIVIAIPLIRQRYLMI